MLPIRILAFGALLILHPLSLQAESSDRSAPRGQVSTDAAAVTHRIHLSSSASGTSHATEGFVTLSWQPAAPLQSGVRLQVAAGPEFLSPLRDIALQGQTQVHLSGFDDGTYSARITDARRQALSNTVSFRVEHRDLRTAWGLFSAGALLFALLLMAILHFTRREQ